MNILHNKELKRYLLLNIAIMIVSFLLVSFFSIPIALLTLFFECLMFGVFFIITKQRYHKIYQLSFYLQDLYEGKEMFDIRDYQEGELSILKSDIYKITQILKQQKDIVLKDRSFLADHLGNISHQIKTPLTSMFVMCELLNDPDLPEKKRAEFIKQMKNQLERMDWLVSTLLKISKIDANTISFDTQEYSLRTLLEESMESLLIPVELKQQEIYIDCDTMIQVWTDKNWTKEAFSNVIKNCIEHTPIAGNIQLICEDNPLHTAIYIRDNGMGIAKEDIPHVFERFYRGKNASKDSVGIGLSLSKTIFLHQNAQIEVQSEVGKGTTFTIRFYK